MVLSPRTLNFSIRANIVRALPFIPYIQVGFWSLSKLLYATHGLCGKKIIFLLPCCNLFRTSSISFINTRPVKNLLTSVLIISFFLFSACEKESALDSALEGTWELRYLKGKPNNSIYKFSGNTFERTIDLKPAGSGTFKISEVTEKDRNSGVVYPYTITFIIDGSKLGTYLKIGDNTMVMSSGQAGVDETHWIYDKVKW